MPNPTTVTAFDNVTITATQKYNDPTAQAFAYVIDGYLSVTNASQVRITASQVPKLANRVSFSLAYPPQ
jgi:hypothetical protein